MSEYIGGSKRAMLSGWATILCAERLVWVQMYVLIVVLLEELLYTSHLTRGIAVTGAYMSATG